LQGQLLLIHGEKDPETKPALAQIHEMLQRHGVSSDTHIVKEANHSFYSLAWEKEILQVIEDWLKKNPEKH
jgi:dipeptidyl aminopeptidase/acylaminoacyl peptidase